jgi:hypothetical protein
MALERVPLESERVVLYYLATLPEPSAAEAPADPKPGRTTKR